MSKNRKIIQQKFEYYFKISVFCLILSFFILAVPLSLVIMFCSMFMALKYSVSKKQLITNKNHYIVESVHPSPLSAYHGFFGSRPFSKTNNFLVSHNIKPIDWGK